MTTNQTIDGVPRELLDRLIDAYACHDNNPHCHLGSDQEAIDELRALLDREVITDDHLRQRIAFLTSEVHARANERDAALGELAELKAAQHQGDPVALFESVIGKNPQAFLTEPVYQVTESEVREFARLLVEQPAPVAYNPQCQSCQGRGSLKDADGMDNGYCGPCDGSGKALVEVVLPERKPIPDQATFNGGNAYYAKCFDEARSWNACLDEVARLNSARPTHANPPPGTEPSGTHHDNDGLDEWRKPQDDQARRAELLESLAKQVYQSWESQPGFVPWVDGGSSAKQDEARQIASRTFELALANQVGD